MHRASSYPSKTKSPSSPHPNGLRQKLDFLNDFEAKDSLHEPGRKHAFRNLSAAEGYHRGFGGMINANQEREHNLLLRRGWTYSTGLVIIWYFISSFCRMPVTIAAILGVSAFLQEDIRNAIGALLQSSRAFEREVPAPHRRANPQSDYNTRTVDPNDHPDMNPRRSWEEALESAAPFVLNQSINATKIVLYHVLRFLTILATMQFLVSVAEHLIFHQHEDQDTIGLFPRYVANVLSWRHLFGPIGPAAATKGFGSA